MTFYVERKWVWQGNHRKSYAELVDAMIYPLAKAKNGRYVTSLLCWIHKCREQSLGQTPRCFAQHEVKHLWFHVKLGTNWIPAAFLHTKNECTPPKKKLTWKSKLDGFAHTHHQQFGCSQPDLPQSYTTKVDPALKCLGNDHHSDLWDAPGSWVRLGGWASISMWDLMNR